MKLITKILNKLFVVKTDNGLIQLFRYFFVGGTAFIFDFGTLFALTEFFKVYYLISATIAFLVGLTVNYILSIIWVFRKHTIKNKKVEFIIFSAIGIFGLILNGLLIWFFTEVVAIHYLFSKILSTVIIFFWNFIIRKFILFK